MASIRLSEDVEAIAQQVAEQRGLGSQRVAVEAIVRTCWQHYLNGNCGTSTSPLMPLPPAPPAPDLDAGAALDSVL